MLGARTLVLRCLLWVLACIELKKINSEQQRSISKLANENARLVKQVCLKESLNNINCNSSLCVQVDLLWQSSPVKAKDGMNGSVEVPVRHVLKWGGGGGGGGGGGKGE